MSFWVESVLAVEVVKVGVGFAVLLWASYHDWKKREVPNVVWVVFLPVAAGLTIFESYTMGFSMEFNFLQLLSVGVSTGIFVAISYVGLWGGADSKALIGLALLFPHPPLLANPPLGYTLPIFPLVVFIDSLIISLAEIPYAVITNLVWRSRTGQHLFEGYREESILRKIGALAVCIKVKSTELKPYDILAEEPVVDLDNPLRRVVLFRKVEEDYRPPKAEELPKYVFITATTPALIFITLGFMAALLFGDILFWLIASLASAV